MDPLEALAFGLSAGVIIGCAGIVIFLIWEHFQ